MTHPNEERFRAGYAAFASGDMEALQKEYLTPDVVWHSVGRNPLAGDAVGIEEVMANFKKTFELSGGTFSIEIHDCVANDEHGVVLGTSRGERNGRTLAQRYMHAAHFRDGKISESWVYPEDQYANDEFWS